MLLKKEASLRETNVHPFSIYLLVTLFPSSFSSIDLSFKHEVILSMHFVFLGCYSDWKVSQHDE